jgi:hypothetical protein
MEVIYLVLMIVNQGFLFKAQVGAVVVVALAFFLVLQAVRY